VAAIIARENADVALLSAVQTDAQAMAIRDELNDLQDTDAWDYHWAAVGGEGQAIITRHTILDRDSHPAWQSACPTSRESQTLVKAKVNINGYPVYLFAIDQQHGSQQADHDARACQATIFKAYADNFTDAPRIIGGDFNANPGTIGSEAWRIQNVAAPEADRFFDSWMEIPLANKSGYPKGDATYGNDPPDPTFGHTKTNRIDYIMYREAFTGGSRALPQAARMIDARDLSTDCTDLVSRDPNDAFISSAACFAPCQCTYIDDDGVRPSDHVPYFVTFRIE
jgi:endonuclease/exonuclease/phosphatase family metal-dependent hydrolase